MAYYLKEFAECITYLFNVLTGYYLDLQVAFRVLISLTFIDIITGYLAAYVSKSLTSRISFRGMARKSIMLCIIGMASIFDQYSGLNSAAIVAIWYSYNEMLSILENGTKAGLLVPSNLIKGLEIFRDKANDNIGKSMQNISIDTTNNHDNKKVDTSIITSDYVPKKLPNIWEDDIQQK